MAKEGAKSLTKKSATRPSTKRTLVQYGEGDAIAVPFENGKWGVAVVARRAASSKRYGAIVAYGIDRAWEHAPDLRSLVGLTIYNTCVTLFCGGRLIAEGKWPVIGTMPEYDRETWIVPPSAAHAKDWKRESDPDKQLVNIKEDVELNSVNLFRKHCDMVSYEEYQELPMDKGAGDSYLLCLAMEMAICDRHPWYYHPTTPHALEVWKECIRRVKAAGLYPKAEPYWKV